MVKKLFLAWVLIFNTACIAVGDTYSDDQFSEVFQGYIEINHGENIRDGTMRLYQLGAELQNPNILKDATIGAINMQDYELAYHIGNAWLEAGGGEEALAIITRIQISTNGIDAAMPYLARLAKEGSPESVYQIISEASGDQALAMINSHPPALRNVDFYAYLALIYINHNNFNFAKQAIEKGLSLLDDSTNLYLVMLYLADRSNESITSIEIIKELAIITDTNFATIVVLYEDWVSQNNAQPTLLPRKEDYIIDKDRVHYSHMRAGIYLLNHGNPEEALQEVDYVERNSPSWQNAVAIKVAALQILDDNDAILNFLKDEIDLATTESLPTIAQLYAEQLEEHNGVDVAHEFLHNLDNDNVDPELLYIKSIYAERAGEIKIAEDNLRKFIQAEPDNAEGYNALGYLFANHNYNLNEGLNLINHALSIEPNSAAIIDSHGWILYRLGYLEQARTRIEDSINLLGNEPHVEILAHYGEILWELGNQEHAIQVWSQAWKIDNTDETLINTVERYVRTQNLQIQ